jgi:hypothetical protein
MLAAWRQTFEIQIQNNNNAHPPFQKKKKKKLEEAPAASLDRHNPARPRRSASRCWEIRSGAVLAFKKKKKTLSPHDMRQKNWGVIVDKITFPRGEGPDR